MIVGNPIIMILKAILNWFRLRRDYITNAVDKIPPEIKDALVAWYSPVKQKLSNYDVIESYSEDFTKWSLDNENGIATVSQNQIHITESIIYYRSVVRQDKARETQSFKVLVSGLTDNQAVQYIYNDGTNYVTLKLTTNGVHELPASIKQRNGFNVEPAGTCDVTIEQLPTSILKDFSGNGNHAYLYGGKGKLNSGMGVYQQDFSNVRGVTTVSANGFELFREDTGGTYLARISIGYWNNKECKLLFETNNTSNLYYIRYRKANNDIVTSVRLHNGENIIPAQDDLTDVSEVIFEGSLRDNEYIRVIEIPDYPDQL